MNNPESLHLSAIEIYNILVDKFKYNLEKHEDRYIVQ